MEKEDDGKPANDENAEPSNGEFPEWQNLGIERGPGNNGSLKSK